MRSDISKQDLYEGVKALIDCENKHIHLTQHKMYTLFSIAFQYMLFQSTKEPGAYIFRIEDAKLAEKLTKKSKDPQTRKFMQSLLVPRKFKFQNSMLYIDFFNVNSWNNTADIPKEKIKGAVIVKDSNTRNIMESFSEEGNEADEQTKALLESLPKDYYLDFLKDVCPNIITISFGEQYDNLHPLEFPFILKKEEKTISGVTIGGDVSWDNLD